VERNHVANPTHSLYVIKPRSRVTARGAGGWHAWNSRTSRRILPPAAIYVYVCGFSTIAGVGRGESLVMLDRGNPRGRAVTSNHPPEIWQRSSTTRGWRLIVIGGGDRPRNRD